MVGAGDSDSLSKESLMGTLVEISCRKDEPVKW